MVMKKLNKLYPQRKVPGTNKHIDRARPAKPVGWRISEETGRLYYEDRENRSDTEKERRYHGGVNRRAEPGKRTAKPSTRTTRSTTTARRVSQVGKRDVQKGRFKFTITAPPSPKATKESVRKGWKFYEPTSTKKLSQAELNKIVEREMLKIHRAKVEHSIVIDKCGNVLCHGVGDKTSVLRFSYAYKTYKNEDFFAKYGSDIIHIHNHPESHGWRKWNGGDVNNMQWCDAFVTFSHADMRNQREDLIVDRRVCCGGHEFRAVITDRNLFLDIRPEKLMTTVNDIYQKSAAHVSLKYPCPSTTRDNYIPTMKKWYREFINAVAVEVDKRFKKEFKKYGLTYTHRVFDKNGW